MHPLPAHVRRLSDSSYLGLGLAAFVLALLAQFAIYMSILQGPLRAAHVELTRPALIRWIKVVAVWQAVVLIAAGAYVVAMTSRHTVGPAWIAPPVGALLGTALPLQVVVMAILRAAKR